MAEMNGCGSRFEVGMEAQSLACLRMSLTKFLTFMVASLSKSVRTKCSTLSGTIPTSTKKETRPERSFARWKMKGKLSPTEAHKHCCLPAQTRRAVIWPAGYLAFNTTRLQALLPALVARYIVEIGCEHLS